MEYHNGHFPFGYAVGDRKGWSFSRNFSQYIGRRHLFVHVLHFVTRQWRSWWVLGKCKNEIFGNVFLTLGLIGQSNEVSDICFTLLGRWAEVTAKIFSLVVLIGANIVYWVLMSNFLYHSVQFFYGKN